MCLRKVYFQEKQSANTQQRVSNKSLRAVFSHELTSKWHNSIGNHALVGGKFHLDQWKVLMSTLMANLTVVTQFVMKGRKYWGGGSWEKSQPCVEASLSGVDYRDARPALVLGSGGQPGLEGEPRVQKWPVGPILIQRGHSVDRRSAAARDLHWGRQISEVRLTHT